MAGQTIDQRFERVHELGAKRHPHTWFTANAAAAREMIGLELNPNDSTDRFAVSLIVLKVLDVAGAP